MTLWKVGNEAFCVVMMEMCVVLYGTCVSQKVGGLKYLTSTHWYEVSVRSFCVCIVCCVTIVFYFDNNEISSFLTMKLILLLFFNTKNS